MMRDAIINFPKQFAFEPNVHFQENLFKTNKFLLCGMGGSHLAADLCPMFNSGVDLLIHSDYGLPRLSEEEISNRLIIASSYSGTTEEVLDGFQLALQKRLPCAVITTGGILLDIAKKHQTPFVQMPDKGIQPRSALGLSFRSLLALIGDRKTLQETRVLSEILDPLHDELRGKELAVSMKDKIPILVASAKNRPIAYHWKTKMNETGKIPAFFNVIPELNHNEMNGFDRKGGAGELSERFYFIFLLDNEDHPKNQRRMKILKQLYEERGLPVIEIEMKGRTLGEKIFSSTMLADWISLAIAELYGCESERVPLVQKFKEMME